MAQVLRLEKNILFNAILRVSAFLSSEWRDVKIQNQKLKYAKLNLI